MRFSRVAAVTLVTALTVGIAPSALWRTAGLGTLDRIYAC